MVSWIRNIFWLVVSSWALASPSLATDLSQEYSSCQTTMGVHFDRHHQCDQNWQNCMFVGFSNAQLSSKQISQGCQSTPIEHPAGAALSCINNTSLLCSIVNQCHSNSPPPPPPPNPSALLNLELEHCLGTQTTLAGSTCPNLPTPIVCFIHERYERDPPETEAQVALGFSFGISRTDRLRVTQEDFSFGLNLVYDTGRRWGFHSYLSHSEDRDTVWMNSAMLSTWRGEKASSFVRLGLGIAEVASARRVGDEQPFLFDRERSLAVELGAGLDFELGDRFFVRPEIGARWIDHQDDLEPVAFLTFGWRWDVR